MGISAKVGWKSCLFRSIVYALNPLFNARMVTIGMNYQVLAGKEQVFERAFQSVLGVMKDMPGHSESHLYKDIEKENSYLIISEWNDKSAFDGFIKSEAFAKVTNWGKEQVLAGRPKHQVYSPQA